MRKILAALMLIAFTSVSVADIHEPPKSKYTKTRKLGRGVANIIYGWTEIPATMYRAGERHTEQASGIYVAYMFQGFQRAGARLKYGFYEVVNFQRPLYKDSFRPPMADINYLPIRGYEEFPPQLGFLTTTGYTRGNSW